MNALAGAEGILKKQAPKLAVCVYHRLQDLWDIPLYVKSVVPEYRLYMRHHAECWVSETVCYAVRQRIYKQ